MILSVPEAQFVRARMTTSHDRIRRFWRGGVDLDWLKIAKESVERRLDAAGASLADIEDFSRFIATRSNQMVLTEPRPVKVIDPEDDLNRLFEELVDHRKPRRRREPVIPELDQAFRRPSLASRIRFDEPVTVPIVGRVLDIPYAYQNGALHLVRPLVVRTGSAIQGMESLATEGDLLQRRSERPCKVIVVPDLPSQPSEMGRVTPEILGALFGEYDLRVVWEDERPAFIAEVEREAHQP